jgi:prepilin-type processing-associated H-X9-DG protein/prepilin-type N-terminal cleavage/methylation domain-containing protein
MADKPKRPKISPAFSLVELLVVIAIIVILIAMLFPALTGAQRAAQRIQCSSQIHQILVLVHNHADTHQGYVPLVGLLSVTETNAAGLNDPLRVRYNYLNFPALGVNDALMCFTASFASDVGDNRIGLAQSVNDLNIAQADPQGFLRIFRCPSHLPDPGPIGGPALYMGNPTTTYGSDNVDIIWEETQSYIYNEAVLGWDDNFGRKRGLITSIRAPSQTMILADGLGGNITRSTDAHFSTISNQINFSTVYNKVPTGPVTLADALSGDSLAGDPQNFDPIRHQGKINVGFADGHVETHVISVKDLANIYLLAP